MDSTENVVSRTPTTELPDSVTEHESPEQVTMLTLEDELALEDEHESPEHDTVVLSLEEPGSPGEPEEALEARALLKFQHAVSRLTSRAGVSTYVES